jgi:hypothetical protein
MSFSPLYPCFTHRLFCGLLCYFVPLYIIRNPIQVHMPKALFLLPNSLLHLLIPPPCLFSFTLASFGHSELFWSHFSNANGHLHPYAICIPSFMPRTLLKNFLLERLWCLFFRFPLLRPWRFGAFTSLEVNLKVKIRYHKFMLRHDTLFRYHRTI